MSGIKRAIVDDCSSAEIYAGGTQYYALLRDADVMVTFTTPRWNPVDGSSADHVVSRLALPLRRAQELVLQLNDFLERNGQSPARALAAAKASAMFDTMRAGRKPSTS